MRAYPFPFFLEFGSKKRSVLLLEITHAELMHISVEPSILYFGTPVVLLSTLNEDGTTNVAPMSSAWWLGWNCMLGLGASSHSGMNLRRERECVLNLPSVAEVEAVNRLARLTGSNPVPPWKQSVGYRHEKNKCEIAGLTSSPSTEVRAPRIDQCPVQLEAVLERHQPFGQGPDKEPGAIAYEVRVVRAHVDEAILVPNSEHRIDPDRWRPLIMSFCRFYGLGAEVFSSTLAEIPEQAYRPAPHMSR
jgi:flavin reductase (DIM6/NTAB) family NADH-FMN oxidoreductase RutF